MKTVEEFIEEIEESAELQDKLAAVKDEGTLAELLKEHDVDGTVEGFANAVKAKAGAEGEISDDDAEAAAGGYDGFFSAAFWERLPNSIAGFFSGK